MKMRRPFRSPATVQCASLLGPAVFLLLAGLAACSEAPAALPTDGAAASPQPEDTASSEESSGSAEEPTTDVQADGGTKPAKDAGADASKPPVLTPGALDTTYGASGVATGIAPKLAGISFSRNGRAVVFERETYAYAKFTVLRPDGKPDTTVGPNGYASVKIPGAEHYSKALLAGARIDDDGTVTVSGGMSQPGLYFTPFVARFRNGSLDTTFGTGGVWSFADTYATAHPHPRYAGGILSGYYVVAELRDEGARPASRRVYSLNASGVADPTFGGSKGYFNVDTSAARYGSALVDGAGALLVFEDSRFGFCRIHRFTTAGVDSAFGTAGVAAVPLPAGASVSGIMAASTGADVVFAFYLGGGAYRLLRVNQSGAIVDTFPGSPTRSIANFGWMGSPGDGRVLTLAGPNLERWQADGTADTFGTAGSVDVSTLMGQDYLLNMAAMSNGATMIGANGSAKAPDGSSLDRWTVRRLAP